MSFLYLIQKTSLKSYYVTHSSDFLLTFIDILIIFMIFNFQLGNQYT